MPGFTNFFLGAIMNPSLRLEPEMTVYLEGDALILRCSAQNPSTITSYNFYKDGTILNASIPNNRLDFSTLAISDSGNYFCNFYRDVKDISTESNKINLKVVERPPSASLSVEPQRNVFIRNQSALLSCILPKRQIATEVSLYQNGREIYDGDNFGVLTLMNIQKRNSGNYSCGYKIVLSGRIVNSYPGKQETLVVIDQPATPNLRYAKNLQNRGTEVELVCEIANSFFPTINGYRFYRNGREIASSQQANHFTINYTLDFDGCYFCQTFIKILGQEILSPKSSEHFLTGEEGNSRNCQEQNTPNIYGISKQGIMLYGSILAGKLFVLICLLIIFGIYLHVIRLRFQKSETDTQ